MLGVGAILAIIFILIGIVMLIVGIVYFEINRSKFVTQPWWVWFLIIGGAVLAVVAGIFLAFTLRGGPDDKKITTTTVQYQQPEPIIY